MEINPKAFEAFAKAQADFKSAIKDAKNPFFKSVYADLPSIWEAVRPALVKNDIFVTQPIAINGAGVTVVRTVVRYKDGTIVEESECPVICKVDKDPQAMGSAITYARRYSLASILCVVTDDDDAEGAVRPQQQPAQSKPAPVEPKIDNTNALNAWSNTIVDLDKKPESWNNHLKSLRTLKGTVDLFNALKLQAATKGLFYDEVKKEFTTMESFKPQPA